MAKNATVAFMVLVSGCTLKEGNFPNASEAESRRGSFYVEVMEESVLLSKEVNARDCILASGSDSLLATLREADPQKQQNIIYQVLPAPLFSPELADDRIGDRIAVVRGQRVGPWCNSNEFFWITGVE